MAAAQKWPVDTYKAHQSLSEALQLSARYLPADDNLRQVIEQDSKMMSLWEAGSHPITSTTTSTHSSTMVGAGAAAGSPLSYVKQRKQDAQHHQGFTASSIAEIAPPPITGSMQILGQTPPNQSTTTTTTSFSSNGQVATAPPPPVTSNVLHTTQKHFPRHTTTLNTTTTGRDCLSSITMGMSETQQRAKNRTGDASSHYRNTYYEDLEKYVNQNWQNKQHGLPTQPPPTTSSISPVGPKHAATTQTQTRQTPTKFSPTRQSPTSSSPTKYISPSDRIAYQQSLPLHPEALHRQQQKHYDPLTEKPLQPHSVVVEAPPPTNYKQLYATQMPNTYPAPSAGASHSQQQQSQARTLFSSTSMLDTTPRERTLPYSADKAIVSPLRPQPLRPDTPNRKYDGSYDSDEETQQILSLDDTLFEEYSHFVHTTRATPSPVSIGGWTTVDRASTGVPDLVPQDQQQSPSDSGYNEVVAAPLQDTPYSTQPLGAYNQQNGNATEKDNLVVEDMATTVYTTVTTTQTVATNNYSHEVVMEERSTTEVGTTTAWQPPPPVPVSCTERSVDPSGGDLSTDEQEQGPTNTLELNLSATHSSPQESEDEGGGLNFVAPREPGRALGLVLSLANEKDISSLKLHLLQEVAWDTFPAHIPKQPVSRAHGDVPEKTEVSEQREETKEVEVEETPPKAPGWGLGLVFSTVLNNQTASDKLGLLQQSALVAFPNGPIPTTPVVQRKPAVVSNLNLKDIVKDEELNGLHMLFRVFPYVEDASHLDSLWFVEKALWEAGWRTPITETVREGKRKVRFLWDAVAGKNEH
eukprot:TRINITY_DN67675_c1_g1_i1.p1 TRINITY_DN67675_c1_g1~~TRINITY_DN67675_c1_g1_i1.p1  ORF type:complete len:833 (+),score=84.73 TRINITY_DN67675_c1_g1_i1:78-2501(+)